MTAPFINNDLPAWLLLRNLNASLSGINPDELDQRRRFGEISSSPVGTMNEMLRPPVQKTLEQSLHELLNSPPPTFKEGLINSTFPIVPALAAVNRIDNATRALIAGPNLEKTRGARAVDALAGKETVSGGEMLRQNKFLRDTPLGQSVRSNDSFQDVINDIAFSPSTYLANPTAFKAGQKVFQGGRNLASSAGREIAPILANEFGAIGDLSKLKTVPEKADTLALQIKSLINGDSKAVLITPGAQTPEIPEGMRKIGTEVGTWIYNPKQVKPWQIKASVDKGDFGKFLGHLEVKSPMTTNPVTAIENGIEAKTSLASPQNVPAQALELKKQFPGAEIRTGGPEAIPNIIDSRVRPPTPSALGNQGKFFTDDIIVKGSSKQPRKNLSEMVDIFKKEFIDRYSAIADFEKLPGKIAPENSPYIAFRNYAGIGGKLENRANEFLDIVGKANGEMRKDLSRYMVAMRELDISQVKGVSTSLAPEQAMADINTLKAKYGDRFGELDSMAQQIWDHNKSMLQKKVEAGLVSPESAEVLLKSEPHYYPIEVIEKRDALSRKFGGGGSSLQAKQGVKALTGRREGTQIADPIESSLRGAFDAETNATKNLAMQKLAALKDKPGMEGMIVELQNPAEQTGAVLKGLQNKIDSVSGRLARRDALEAEIAKLEGSRRAVFENTPTLRTANQALAKEQVAGNTEGLRLADQQLREISRDLFKANKRLAAKDVQIELGRQLATVNESIGSAERTVAGRVNPGAVRRAEARLVELRSKKQAIEEISRRARALTEGQVQSPELVNLGQVSRYVRDLAKRESSASAEVMKQQSLRFTERRIAELRGQLRQLPPRDRLIRQLNEANLSATRVQEKGLGKFSRQVKVPDGMEAIRVFENGVERNYAVPKEISAAVKGLDASTADLITRGIASMTGAFRAGTTGSNLLFTIPNAIRDFSTVALTEGVTPAQWAKALAQSAKHLTGKEAKIVTQFKEAGGAFGGLAGQIKDLDRQSKLIDAVTKTKWERALQTVTSPKELFRKPLDMINTFSEILENAPRVAAFSKRLKAGASEAEAAFAARNSTVDFSKSGNTMRVFNMLVPFINARLQGNLNVVKSLIGAARGQNTARVAAVAGAYALAPAAALYAYNKHYFRDLYDDVPDYIKDNYFVVMLGSKEDREGKQQPLGIKIPKPELAKIVGNTAESILDSLYQDKALNLSKLLVQTTQNFSPIDFERDGKVSASKLVGGILPPIAKAPIEAISNYDFFRDKQIEPRFLSGVETRLIEPRERYNDRTTAFAKKVGDITNTSPIMIDHLVRGTFGQLGTHITSPSKFLSEGKSRFILDRGGAQDERAFQILDNVKRGKATEKLLINRLSSQLAENPTPELKAQIRERPELALKILERFQKIKQKKEKDMSAITQLLSSGQFPIEDGSRALAVSEILKTLPSEESRNKQILEWFQGGVFPDAGKNPEGFKKFFDQLAELKGKENKKKPAKIKPKTGGEVGINNFN